MIRKAQREYLELPDPPHALVCIASPGTGKTTIGVETAEHAASQGWRVLYCGPRHDFFLDVLRLAGHPEWWYEWRGRELGDDERGIPATCRHAPSVNAWIAKGYRGIEFCAGVCGWDYVNKACPYYAQKNRREPIIFGQHQHVWGGHPLKFRLLIGDESPFAVFCHEWVIPARYVMPEGLDPTEPIAEILHELQGLAESASRLEGPALLAALGGATRVREAVEELALPASALALAPVVHTPADAERAPYFHLPKLATLLAREAAAAERGREYPHRVVVHDGKLLLLLRRRVAEQLPRRVIWLDATGDRHLYEAILQTPVEMVEPRVRMRGRILQVHDRANGKGALLDGEGNLKGAVNDLKRQVKRIAERYQSIGVITHMAIEDQFAEYPDRGHFYAERGTNRFERVEALVVAGIPQPPLFQIDKAARMLFWERMEPFASTRADDGTPTLPWSSIDKPFAYVGDDGLGRAYPASGFWGDPDLQSVLWQFREAELIQAAHRARPNLRDVDVWLLENLPVDELPPAKLLPARELFGAPRGVDIYRWPDVLALAELHREAGLPLSAADIAEQLCVGVRVARDYLRKLFESQAGVWELDKLVPVGHGGKPTRVLRPRRGNYGPAS